MMKSMMMKMMKKMKKMKMKMMKMMKIMVKMVKIDTYANSDSMSIAEYEEYRNKYPLIAEGSIYDDISETHKQVVEFIKSIQLPF